MVVAETNFAPIRGLPPLVTMDNASTPALQTPRVSVRLLALGFPTSQTFRGRSPPKEIVVAVNLLYAGLVTSLLSLARIRHC
jgi:hypothetical protein